MSMVRAMSIKKREWTAPDGTKRWAYQVRWADENGDRRSKTFQPGEKGAAEAFERKIKSAKAGGTLHAMESGEMTLAEFVLGTWMPGHAENLAPKTRRNYASLWEVHLGDAFGHRRLRTITPKVVRDWQSKHLKDGYGPVATRKALGLLSSILALAVEDEILASNPVAAVRKAPLPRREEIRPLSPSQIELLRDAMLHPDPIWVREADDGYRKRAAHWLPAPGTPATRLRDATLVSMLGYAGLRPDEALILPWSQVLENTIRVWAPKTDRWRSVRLMRPLASDLGEWREVNLDDELVFPGIDQDNWRARNWERACQKADIDARVYDLRHSFASLLIVEGLSIIEIARELGHGAQLTLETYGHVLSEYKGVKIDAETAILEARCHKNAT